MPQPERLSELYFTDHAALPKLLNAGSNHSVNFTVHNLEHQTTTYHYKIVAALPDSEVIQPLAEGTFMLDHNQSHKAHQDIAVPGLGPRIGIRVDLYYQHDKAQDLATQSINYWVAINTTNQASL